MPGMMKGAMYKKGGAVKKGAAKFQQGGPVRGRRGPSMEEDMTPPRGMREFRSNAVPTNEPPPGRPERRSFEEDMTPPRGMRGLPRPQMVPTDEPPPGRPSRMKKGGMVKKKAGGMIKKAKGGMIGGGCK